MDEQTVTQTQPVSEPSVWADISAELHKLADDVLDLVGEPAPACFDVSIQPRNPDPFRKSLVKNRPAIIATVDAIALALLDKPSQDSKMSDGSYHRDAKGRRGPIGISILTSIADPDAVDPEMELARLRAENEMLKGKLGGLAFSREPDDVQPGRVPPHLEDGRKPGVPVDRRTCVDPGDQEHDHAMCADVVAEDAERARAVPPTDPGDLPGARFGADAGPGYEHMADDCTWPQGPCAGHLPRGAR